MARQTDNDFGTWNVRSLYKTGALRALLQEIDKYNIDLIALQETRWIGNAIYDYKGHTVIYSGKENGQHEFGTAFIINKNI